MRRGDVGTLQERSSEITTDSNRLNILPFYSLSWRHLPETPVRVFLVYNPLRPGFFSGLFLLFFFFFSFVRVTTVMTWVCDQFYHFLSLSTRKNFGNVVLWNGDRVKTSITFKPVNIMTNFSKNWYYFYRKGRNYLQSQIIVIQM